MGPYLLASIASGILFGILDGVINANPLAQRLYRAYSPIMKKSINILAGVGIDLAYGFIMAAIFLLLYQSLPGETGLVKGLSFGLLAWFFRVLMSAASSWVMFDVPASLIIYNLMTGLAEMDLIGLLYGLILKPG
jgi:hypothetical protein